MPTRKMSAPAGEELTSTGSSAERSLRLLALLANEGRALALAELSVRLGLPKVTAHRLCSQLLDAGFLARDVDERCYAVGPALRQLAFDTLNHGVVRGLRHEVLAALVTDVGETCNFTTLDGSQVLYVDRVEAQWPLRLSLDVGSHVPLHCTASGKLFLSQMNAAEARRLLGDEPYQQFTTKTITRFEPLQVELAKVRRTGVGIHDCERFDDSVAIAVPVLGSGGTIFAAVAMHAPSSRASIKSCMGFVPSLKRAAVTIASTMSRGARAAAP